MDKYDIIKTTKTYQKVVDDFINGKMSHCSLLITPDKMSREIFGVVFASLLICQDKNDIITQNIIKHIHPDVFFLPKSGILKVEDVEFVLERLNYYPMEAECKVFILENFSSATLQAQNKLLKTLEETPNNVYFLLCSEKEDGILPTIKSRCQILELEPLSENALNIMLSEFMVDAKTMEVAKFYGRGELGRIEEALTDPNILSMVDLSFDIVKNCKSSNDILSFAVRVEKFKNSLTKFVQIYSDVIQEILRIKILNTSEYKLLNFNELVNNFSVDAILVLQDRLIKFLEMLDRFCNPILVIDELLIQTCKCKIM